MKNIASILLILLLILLVACQNDSPQATAVPEPTVAAEDTPVEEASPEAAEATVAPTAVPTEETASAGALPRVEPLDECFVEMPEGAGYECLRVEVPEFHNEDNGRSIKLGVIRLLSTADTPSEPLFFAEGGPGGSNVDTAAQIAQSMVAGDETVYTDLLSTRDLVFFTQRGTLYAEPALMCSEESMEPMLEAFYAGLSVQEREQISTDAIKACYEEFADAGVDFAAYNSVENAADINSIREVLGYDQIVLYGDSYGTVLSQHVMRDYPDTLAAVILDGVDTLNAPSWVTGEDAELQSALEYAIGLCAADKACSEAYPDLAEDVEAVYQKLQAEPYVAEVDGKQIYIDENLAASAFFTALYSPITASFLPLGVDTFLNEKQDERSLLLLYGVFPRFESISLPMHYAMVCSEDPVTSVDDAISLDEVYSVVSESARSEASGYIEMCSYMNLPVLPDETDVPISSDLPVLLLSGALDPATPASNAEEVLATLPNGFSFEFPYGGHVQFLTGDACAASIVASFIADPTTEPDSRCIAEAVPLQFALPAAPTEIPTEETASTGALPRVEHLDECFVEMPEGADYECVRVEVPEFHNEDNGRSIKLGVIRLLSTADTLAEPLFFAEGGPGGSNVDQAAAIAQNMLDGDETVYTDLLSTRDLVFFTQRGTSYAEPALMCSEESTNPYMEVFFSSSSPQERAGAETEAYKACLEEFTEAGIDFAAYNSVESAADINSIRELLGYDQIVLYGDSYGTLLAQHVMRDYPDTLTTVILDGIVPLSSPTWDSQLDARYQSALAYLIGLCAADEACSEAYPNLSADIEAVYQKLQAEPNLVDQGGRQLNVDENLAAWAFHDAMLSPPFASYLPLAVDSLLNDKLDDQMMIIFIPIIPNFEGISFPMHFAVVCSEAPVTSVDDAISLDEVSSVVSEYVQSDTYRYIEMCSHLNLPLLSEEMKAPISSDIPVLLLSGAFDSTTPPFNAEAIAGTLPNSFSFEFPYGGHVQFLSGDACAESIVTSFIADPTTEPDSRCIAEALPLQFALPAEQ